MAEELTRITFMNILATIIVIFVGLSNADDPSRFTKLIPTLTPDDEVLQLYERQTVCIFQEDINAKLDRETIYDSNNNIFNLDYTNLIDRECAPFNRNYLKFFFSLFFTIAWGAIVRVSLRFFKLNIPYTVVLIITGLFIGMGTRITDSFCVEFSVYTKIARTPPKIILLVFLPVLIFESSFGMKAHVFYRSILSILVLALPGMLMTTMLTAVICQYFLYEYHWSFIVAALFGSIISATDPVAVVAILKEIGTSETLSIIVDGESLLNDGVAILFFEIFLEIVKEPHPPENQGAQIFFMFMRITIGGPLLGYIIAKLSIFSLRRIFNDPAVEVTITLSAAYLTYYIADEFLGVSGVMAVVILGVVLNSEKTCISPEVQGLVHHFWEMLGYLANTVLFVLVGVVISETAINSFTKEDGYYLIFLYIMLNIVRLFMIVAASPVLGRVGYGLSWQNMAVVSWGGLRGAVGMCLSLQVFKDQSLCDKINIGPKFLIQTAGIVILTLLINGTTTKAMLDMLRLTELSVGKIQDMGNAVKQVEGAQLKTMATLKHDRFLADSNWDLVQEYTSISNPYEKSRVKKTPKSNAKVGKLPSLLTLNENVERIAVCPNCDEQVKSEPTADEYRLMTEEARLRLIKALKVSCWRQYEQGVLTEEAVQTLVSVLESTEDNEYSMLHCSDIDKHWQIRGIVPWLRKKCQNLIKRQAEKLSNPPNERWRMPFYRFTESDSFEAVMNVIIILNMIPAIYEAILIFTYQNELTLTQLLGFFYTNVAFTAIYIFEFLFKIVGHRANDYWSSGWNIIDFLVLIITLVELSLSALYLPEAMAHHHSKASVSDAEFLKFLRFVRLFRVARIIRLFRPAIPTIMLFMDSRINLQLFFGFDVGKGFVMAIDDVTKFLPQMVEHPRVLSKLQFAMHVERLETIRSLGVLKIDHPGIAIAVKTRHTSRSILNHMRESLYELKEDGLVDEKEFNLVILALEARMKRLWESPSYIPPPPPETFLHNVSWVIGSDDLLNYVIDNATLLTFSEGDVLCKNNDPPNGIYIMVSGLIKIHYEPTIEIITDTDECGKIPIMELFEIYNNYEYENHDYFSGGYVIGELGVLTNLPRNASVECETEVNVYHISQSAIQKALEAFNDPYNSLESRMWRSYGIQISTVLLSSDPNYISWPLEKIKAHIERSAVPAATKVLSMSIPDFIADVIVIYGQVVNHSNEDEIYTAPCIIPHTVTKLASAKNADILPRLLVISKESTEEDEPDMDTIGSSLSLHKLITVAGSMRKDSYPISSESKQKRMSLAVNFGVNAKTKKNLKKINEEEENRRMLTSQSAEPNSKDQYRAGDTGV